MNMIKKSMVVVAAFACGAVFAAEDDGLQELMSETEAAPVAESETVLASNEDEASERAPEAAPQPGEAVGWTPLAVSIASPVQIPWGTANWDVKGLYLGLFYNDAPIMWGVDLSLANRVRDDFRGFAFGGLCNYARPDVYGIRTSLGFNVSRGTLYGIDLGGFGLHQQVYGADIELVGCAQENLYGTEISLLGNYSHNECYGATFGGFNVAKVVYGAQIGFLFNQATELNGCQIGIFNYAQECPWGFQLGLVNIITDNVIKALPIFNCYFGSSEQ